MTEEELISKIQSLKQIKPNREWVLLAKHQILDSASEHRSIAKARYAGMFGNILKLSFTRNFAYSMAVLLFVATIGTLFVLNGLLFNTGVNVPQNSTASLVAIKDNVEEFKTKSKNLAEVARHASKDVLDVSLIAKEVESIAKEITAAIKKDPALAKEVALEVNNNKTYLEIDGGSDLKETSNTLYKTIVEQMIKDLEDTMLTENQQESFARLKISYEGGDYTNALENILLLNIAIEDN